MFQEYLLTIEHPDRCSAEYIHNHQLRASFSELETGDFSVILG